MRDGVDAPHLAAVDDVLALFARHGDQCYGEDVTQRSHACQAAALAVADAADAQVVVAALLHDVGHLLGIDAGDDVDAADDSGHESRGARWLAVRFGRDVAVTVALHVQAKRYLCAVEPNYVRGLSSESLRSLGAQGGPMDDAEVARFVRLAAAPAAIALRRYDDAAKDVGLRVGSDVPDVVDYTGTLAGLASGVGSSGGTGVGFGAAWAGD